MSASSSAGDFVALAVNSAWASVFVPPQHVIQSGRGSDRPAACRIRSEPAEWSVGPTASMPYSGCPDTTSAFKAAASGNPG